MKKCILFVLMIGFIAQSYAQDPKIEQLSEIVLIATNYKYLDKAGEYDVDPAVDRLQRTAATYDIKNSEMYRDDYDKYYVSFFIPEGKILASYDKDGKILRTAEKYKDIYLPQSVKSAVTFRYPNWTIAKDIYLVNYYEEGESNKRYKLKLVNGDKTLRVKVDENGNFL